MKVLLLDSALGMTPGKERKGRYDANGGYLVVKKDGDIVCYHFYNRTTWKITYITIPVLKGQVGAVIILAHCIVVKMGKSISN